MEERRANPVPKVAPLKTTAGVALCVTVAAIMSAIFAGHPYRSWLPLLFIVVIMFTAARFGPLAGLLGATLAAVVFAYLLFTPVGSLRIDMSAARENVGWMLLIGIPAGWFLAASQSSDAASLRNGDDVTTPR